MKPKGGVGALIRIIRFFECSCSGLTYPPFLLGQDAFLLMALVGKLLYGTGCRSLPICKPCTNREYWAERDQTEHETQSTSCKKNPGRIVMAELILLNQANVDPHIWSIVETNAISARRSQSEPGVDDSEELQPVPLGTAVKRDNTYTIVTASTPSQTNSMAIDEDGTDYFYFSTIQFGSSGKSMHMLIDTGSANTWVIGSGCTTKACTSHNTFGPTDSTTLRPTQSRFDLTYGTGTVAGMIFNDTVKMAGITLPLSFGLASTTSDDFSTYPMDGILGLGRPISSNMDSPSVMEVVESAKALPQNLFGVSLQRNSDGSTDGELSFGAPDPTKYTGDLLYTNTDSNGSLWEIPIGDTALNGVSCHFTGKRGIVDSGTSFMLLPPNDAKTLHDRIPNSVQASDGFQVPCSSSMPIQITISNFVYNVSSKDYIGSPVNGGSMCSSNIIARQTFGPDQWLLGDVFLKNVYTVFDFDRNRIGKIVQIPSLFNYVANILTGFGIKNTKQSSAVSSSSQVSSSKSSTTSSSLATTSPNTISSSGPPSPTTVLLPASQVPSSSTASATTPNAPTGLGSPPSSTSASPRQSAASSAASQYSFQFRTLLLCLFFVFIVYTCT